MHYRREEMRTKCEEMNFRTEGNANSVHAFGPLFEIIHDQSCRETKPIKQKKNIEKVDFPRHLVSVTSL